MPLISLEGGGDNLSYTISTLNHLRNNIYTSMYITSQIYVLHIPLAETIKELDNFILKGVDLYDHTKVFL